MLSNSVVMMRVNESSFHFDVTINLIPLETLDTICMKEYMHEIECAGQRTP